MSTFSSKNLVKLKEMEKSMIEITRALAVQGFWNIRNICHSHFVKLHSELADPTQLQLVRVGVEFVLPCHNPWNTSSAAWKNPHLASTRGNYPTCWKFGGCPLDVKRVSGNCLEGVLWNLLSVWWIFGGFLEGTFGLSKWCVGCPDVSEGQVRTRQVRKGQVRIGQLSSGQDKKSQVRTGQVKLRQVKTSQDLSSQSGTVQIKSGLVKSSGDR